MNYLQFFISSLLLGQRIADLLSEWMLKLKRYDLRKKKKKKKLSCMCINNYSTDSSLTTRTIVVRMHKDS